MVKTKVLDGILSGLMRKYVERVEDVENILSGMIDAGMIKSRSVVDNDHIAFRTLGVPNLGIASFEKIFLNCGYVKMDFMYFKTKKINAYWYAPSIEQYPRIFISELRIADLSQKTQKIIKKYTKDIIVDPVDKLDLNNWEEVNDFLHNPLWSLPSLSDYEALLAESEYAAWVIYNRYYLNHFTISVHALPDPYNSLASYNTFVESLGIRLNDAGGVIKISKDGLLLQSSTISKMISAIFFGGEKKMIPGSYVEFAERRLKPEFNTIEKSKIRRVHLRDGFEVGNADKIFESTYSNQTSKGK